MLISFISQYGPVIARFRACVPATMVFSTSVSAVIKVTSFIMESLISSFHSIIHEWEFVPFVAADICLKHISDTSTGDGSIKLEKRQQTRVLVWGEWSPSSYSLARSLSHAGVDGHKNITPDQKAKHRLTAVIEPGWILLSKHNENSGRLCMAAYQRPVTRLHAHVQLGINSLTGWKMHSMNVLARMWTAGVYSQAGCSELVDFSACRSAKVEAEQPHPTAHRRSWVSAAPPPVQQTQRPRTNHPLCVEMTQSHPPVGGSTITIEAAAAERRSWSSRTWACAGTRALLTVPATMLAMSMLMKNMKIGINPVDAPHARQRRLPSNPVWKRTMTESPARGIGGIISVVCSRKPRFVVVFISPDFYKYVNAMKMFRTLRSCRRQKPSEALGLAQARLSA